MIPTRQAAQARSSNRALHRGWYAELSDRDLCASAAAILRERGEFDPDDPGHRAVAAREPLSAAERLAHLAIGEVLARCYRHPSMARPRRDGRRELGTDQRRPRHQRRPGPRGTTGSGPAASTACSPGPGGPPGHERRRVRPGARPRRRSGGLPPAATSPITSAPGLAARSCALTPTTTGGDALEAARPAVRGHRGPQRPAAGRAVSDREQIHAAGARQSPAGARPPPQGRAAAPAPSRQHRQTGRRRPGRQQVRPARSAPPKTRPGILTCGPVVTPAPTAPARHLPAHQALCHAPAGALPGRSRPPGPQAEPPRVRWSPKIPRAVHAAMEKSPCHLHTFFIALAHVPVGLRPE